jgi:CBS domain-containing protein
VKVRDIMTTPVVTVELATPVAEAATLLAKHRITAMPVVDDDRLVGMVSEADMLRDLPAHDPRAYVSPERAARRRTEPPVTVDEVMTTPVVAVSPSSDTSDVAGLMLDYDVRSIPVVEGGRVVGIVSRRDLIRLLVQDDELIASDVRRRLDEYSGRPDQWDVTVSEGRVTIEGDFDDENERRVVNVLASTVPGVREVHTGPPVPA